MYCYRHFCGRGIPTKGITAMMVLSGERINVSIDLSFHDCREEDIEGLENPEAQNHGSSRALPGCNRKIV
jgi:hypothetical protein